MSPFLPNFFVSPFLWGTDSLALEQIQNPKGRSTLNDRRLFFVNVRSPDLETPPKNHFQLLDPEEEDFPNPAGTDHASQCLWILIHVYRSAGVSLPEHALPLPTEARPLAAKVIAELPAASGSHHPSLQERFRVSALVDLLMSSAFDTGMEDPFPEFTSYVREHMNEPLTADSIAAGMGIGEPKMIKMVRRLLQTTPARYVRDERLLLAQQLLANTTASIELIAEQTHYSDRFTFTRAFRATTGLSPGQFRKQWQPDGARG